jgi:hypothetical protein
LLFVSGVGTRFIAFAIALAACNPPIDPSAVNGGGADNESFDGSGGDDSGGDDGSGDEEMTGDHHDEEQVPPSEEGPPPLPTDTMHLSETGLCLDAACTTITPGIVEFRPRWPLWTDGAAKRRWIQLPPGASIDDTDMNYWSFPVGTKLWKEFVRDGVRVETRYAVRTGPNEEDWQLMPFAWNGTQTDAVAVPDGYPNANGTQHDIPPASACMGCHENVKSRVLGFSALQLDYDAAPDLMDLDDAIDAGWLTHVPGAATPHIVVPGNATEQAALGYLHGNCGHCHNSDSPLINRPMFRLETGYLDTLANTRTYISTVNVVADVSLDGATIVAKPGAPDQSVIIKRMTTTNPAKLMPALGVELVDPAGQTAVRAWITALPQ